MMSLSKYKKLITPVNILVVLILVFSVVPLIILGQNSIMTVHDSLDHVVPWAKMLKDNGLLLAIDSPTNQLGNMSTAYFTHITYDVYTVPFLFFDAFSAHLIGYIIYILLGYISMFILLNFLFSDDKYKSLIKLISVSYALLPAIPNLWFSMASVPLIVFFFLKIKEMELQKLNKVVFLLVLYPFVSNFAITGFFVLSIWALSTIILWIWNRRININLLIGFLCLAIGYIIVDFKLFYVILFLREPLNRGGIIEQIAEPLSGVLSAFPGVFLFGSDYLPVLAHMVMFPAIIITLFIVLIYLLKSQKNNEQNLNNSYLAKYSLQSIALLICTFICTFFYTAYLIQGINKLINIVFPFLSGFNWGNMFFFSRFIIYISFALTLITLLFIFAKRKARFIAYIIACLQIFVVLSYQGMYAYTGVNINHRNQIQFDYNLSYKEFFSVELFDLIKGELGYKGEGVAALGYHPSVLMYNGFSCVDGYNNSYPMKYMLAFREIIAPQLERNHVHQEYFDSWGGRMYLYNDDIGFEPTRKKADSPVELFINTEAFQNLGGVYILSRAEISNIEDLDLSFVEYFSSDSSIYEIYVYKVS